MYVMDVNCRGDKIATTVMPIGLICFPSGLLTRRLLGWNLQHVESTLLVAQPLLEDNLVVGDCIKVGGSVRVGVSFYLFQCTLPVSYRGRRSTGRRHVRTVSAG